MQKDIRPLGSPDLFGRVVSILETARTNVVRSVNSEMVTAYWLIGREIVEEMQSGEKRAEYGRTLIKTLSKQLNERFGKGFSVENLKCFRKFYLSFSDWNPVADSLPDQLGTQCVSYSSGFIPSLGWSHYRVLMRVEHPDARAYYEREAASNGWSVRQLERQIHSLFFERLLKSSEREKMEAQIDAGESVLKPIDVNYFDLKIREGDDNPTVGLLLCTEKNDSVVRYILGEENEQIFAAKYQLALPTKEQLEAELRKERLLIEECVAQYG